jgi:hypothetical protein
MFQVENRCVVLFNNMMINYLVHYLKNGDDRVIFYQELELW